jgi:hypothetical protein
MPASEFAEAAGKGGSGGSGRSAGNHSGKGHSGKNHSRHHHHNRSAVAAGVFVGGLWWPWWDYPAYYYPPVPLAAMPVAYIERSEQEGQVATEWLYCVQAQGYFPYVAECADGWERVPVAPLK